MRKSSEALNHQPEESQEVTEGDSLFKGQEDLIAEGDEILGVKSVEEENAIRQADKEREAALKEATAREETKEIESGLETDMEKKKKAAMLAEQYNYLFAYHELSSQVVSGGKAELSKIGTDLGEEKTFLMQGGADLAEEAGLKVKSDKDLALLPLGGKGYSKLDKDLRAKLKEHNEAVKELQLKEEVFKDLWRDVQKFRNDKVKITPRLLLQRGLTNIEWGLRREWDKKKTDAQEKVLKEKTRIYNELSRALPELQFSELEKNYAQNGILLTIETENKEPKTKKVKQEKIHPAAVSKQEAVADYGMQKTKEQAAEEQEVARLMELKQRALAETQDEDVRDILAEFNPEEYARNKTKFFAAQKDLMDLGALPNGGFGNTLKMLFKYPGRFGEYRALKAKYNALERELAAQDEVVESYLNIWSKKLKAEKSAKERQAVELPAASSRVKQGEPTRLAEAKAKIAQTQEEKVLLTPYQDDVNKMEAQLENIKNDYPEVAKSLNFTAKDYWLDYDKMIKLQDLLERECGFSPLAGEASNRLKAMTKGKSKVYKEFKPQYDAVVDKVEKRDKFLESYGGLGTKLEVKKKVRKAKKEGSVVDRLNKSA